MGLNTPIPGYNLASELQVPGVPWVTSSIMGANIIDRYDFPFVSKTLVVTNVSSSGDLRIAFSRNGLLTNYFRLTSGSTLDQELRITQLFVSGTNAEYSVLAGLSGIPVKYAPILTGSDGYSGIG
jgi:hypothetical protein